MKLYLAIENTNTLMEGTYEQVVGVYSTREKARAALETYNPRRFAEAEVVYRDGMLLGWRYVFDGELSYFFCTVEITLDQGRYD